MSFYSLSMRLTVFRSIPISVAIDRWLRPVFASSRTLRLYFRTTGASPFFLPSTFPFCFARAKPDRTRSLSKSASNCDIPAKSVAIIRPFAVLKSTSKPFSAFSDTPRPSSSSKVESRSGVERPHLKISVTRIASISRRCASARIFRRSGRASFRPLAVSWKTPTTSNPIRSAKSLNSDTWRLVYCPSVETRA